MSLDVSLQCVPCPHCGRVDEGYDSNITHNLGSMADHAGIYKHLWRPDEVGVKKASDLIGPLEKAIDMMEGRAWYYKQFDASNGWGTYDQFLPWLKELLEACKKWPDANFESRG